MRATAALIGLVLVLLLIPGFAPVREPTIAFEDDGTPLRGPPLDELLVTAIMAHADNMLPQDELVEFDGLSVKKSNYHGVAFADRTYYYCLAPHFCSCPVCRGILGSLEIDLVYLDETADFPTAIYTLP